jgi:hypothetical protein
VVTLSLLKSRGGFWLIAVKAVILLEALVALFLFNDHSDFIPVKKLWWFFFLLKSRGGCNPVESRAGCNPLRSRGGFFLFNGYSNFIPV